MIRTVRRHPAAAADEHWREWIAMVPMAYVTIQYVVLYSTWATHLCLVSGGGGLIQGLGQASEICTSIWSRAIAHLFGRCFRAERSTRSACQGIANRLLSSVHPRVSQRGIENYNLPWGEPSQAVEQPNTRQPADVVIRFPATTHARTRA